VTAVGIDLPERLLNHRSGLENWLDTRRIDPVRDPVVRIGDSRAALVGHAAGGEEGYETQAGPDKYDRMVEQALRRSGQASAPGQPQRRGDDLADELDELPQPLSVRIVTGGAQPQATITILRKTNPVFLVLQAVTPVVWTIRPVAGARVAGILIVGPPGNHGFGAMPYPMRVYRAVDSEQPVAALLARLRDHAGSSSDVHSIDLSGRASAVID
jgi:hypothetical protein